MTVRSGTVYLVGAGPGDVSLITVRGRELLKRADVIVHDRLIDPALLDLAPPTTEFVDAGKRPYAHTLRQDEINQILVDRARKGLAVVRLKGGDPFVFGRGFEEMEACAQAGVPCEIVPGVSSVLAAPAAAGLPTTLRGLSRGFSVITARHDGAAPDAVELGQYAHGETLIVLMGVEALPSLAGELLRAGRDPQTPVAIIERAWMPGQQSVRAPLVRIVEAAREARIASPAVILVGEVAGAKTSAPSVRPLVGRRIVVTRPTTAASELIERLRRLGGHVIHAPLIDIRPIDPDPSWVQALEGIEWLVVTSRHGARGFSRALRRAGLDARALGGARIAAVGPVTAREARACGLEADLVPPVFRASSLAEELIERSAPGATVLFARGTLARDELPAALRQAGLSVRAVDVYETRLARPTARVRAQIAQGVDSVLFASPSAVRAYAHAELVGEVGSFVCIGPTTAAEAARAGLADIVTAETHSDEGLVSALLDSRKPIGVAT